MHHVHIEVTFDIFALIKSANTLFFQTYSDVEISGRANKRKWRLMRNHWRGQMLMQ